MKLPQIAKRFGAAFILSTPVFAMAAGSGNPVLDSVDFSSVAAWVGGAGVVIVGIAMAFKGISLGKRAVNKV